MPLVADWTAGAQVAVAQDLPDTRFPDGASFRPGAALVVPVRGELAPGAGVRLTLELGAATGHDVVAWTEGGWRYESDQHWTMATWGRLAAGPEVVLRPARRASPYLGAEAGLAVVGSWHSFGGDTQALLDPAENDLGDPRNVDPFTVQGAPAAGLHAGVRVARVGTVDLEIELGYTVAFLPGAPLRRTPPALDATRAAYALDVVRLGLGIAIPRGPE